MISKKETDQIHEMLECHAKERFPGFAVGVMQDNEVVYFRGFGMATLDPISPITPDTVFDVGSMAKQFTGMTIALLEEQGKLNIQDSIQTYLPDFADYARDVTVANLLFHTSGIRNYTVLAYYIMGYHPCEPIPASDVYEMICRLRSLNFPPGNRYEYSDSNYFLLAKIVEKITGQTLNTFARESIFEPLRMTSTCFHDQSRVELFNQATGYVNYPVAIRSPYLMDKRTESPDEFHPLTSRYDHVGAEGLWTSLNDMMKWSRNFFHNCLGKGRKELIQRFLTPGVSITPEFGYGYGINSGQINGRQFFSHDGAIHGFTSSMICLPEEKLVVICLGNQTSTAAWEIKNRILEKLAPEGRTRAMTSALNEQIASIKHVELPTGRYQDQETASIWEIVCRDNRMYLLQNKDWEYELHPINSSEFETDSKTIKLRITAGSGDKAKQPELIISNRTRRIIPFLDPPPRRDDLAEYNGIYYSDELRCRFEVETSEDHLIIRNCNPSLFSMDLAYYPTIRDSFVAYDPHPESSQITFLRSNGCLTAFIYRDYDGDGREAILFERNLA